MEPQFVEPVVRDPKHHRHHPWRVFGTFTDWKLRWTDDLPFGHFGRTCHRTKTVYMLTGMDEAERRCTIAHETWHIRRGPVAEHLYAREELVINRKVGRLLVPSVRRIGHALAWHQADYEKAAWDLWVDDQIFDVRLQSLTPREHGMLREHLATILV